MTIDEAIHDRWAQMTDNGKADSHVADLERACDDFFNQQHGRYNVTDEARTLFSLFRQCAIDDLKKRIVAQSPPSAHVEAQVGTGVYSGPKYW